MNSVFLLWHVHTLQDGSDDEKLIGVYRTELDATDARARALKRPGFREHPAGFIIDECELNADEWTKGYASLVTVMMPLLDSAGDAMVPVQAALWPNERYEIVTPNEERAHWAFRTGQIVSCEVRTVDGGVLLVATAPADGATDPTGL